MRAAAPATAPVLSGRELAVARTVTYASLFDYPLTLPELRASLIGSALTEAEVLAVYRASPTLRSKIRYEAGFFFPAGRRESIGRRGRREQISLAFLEQHRAVLTAICALPFVRMVAVSGSLAHLNLEGGGDLDLFVVTRGRRAWSVTVAIVLLAKILGRRRTVCANFVLADTRLDLDQRDLFTANQIIHLKPVVGAEVLEELVAANPFVTAFYPNFAPPGLPIPPFAVEPETRWPKRALEVLLAGPWAIAEATCRLAYRSYLRRQASAWRSPTRVALDRDRVKLHTQSHCEPVLARFDAAVEEALGCEPPR